MSLQQIIYTSHATRLMRPDELVELLRRSRERNTKRGVSGLLLYADGSFMQTIEGPFDTVHALFAKIEADPRHGGLILICDEPIERRSFAEWSMAFREISARESERIAGFKRLTSADPGSTRDRDLARRLMQGFATTLGIDGAS